MCCVLLAVFCISGILLNHRGFSDSVSVPRWMLPPFYYHKNWNAGLLRGTLPTDDARVLVFGTGGVFIADLTGSDCRDFNAGLPSAAAARNVRAMTRTSDGSVWMATGDAVYRLDSDRWEAMLVADGDRFSDLTARGDTIIAVGRSFLNVSPDGGRTFERIVPTASAQTNLSGTTAFRIVWMLHSGELFGLPGRLVVDLVAVVTLVLCLTGFFFWLKRYRHGIHAKFHLKVHRKAGVWTIALVALVFFTGWMLRPPFMVPLALWKTEAPRGTALHDDSNLWRDKLRMLRFDDATGRWLLSSSQGFFSSERPEGPYTALEAAPPVSVMGLNVWEKTAEGAWLCGSFSGMFVWDSASGETVDWYTGEPAAAAAGPPVGKKKVSGYSADFGEPFAVLYNSGTESLPQPEELKLLPMPLWTAALEAHSGRIYFGESATWFFVLFAGAIALWCLYSGWKVRRPHARLSKS